MKAVTAMTRDELEDEVVWLREELGQTISDDRLARVMGLGVTAGEATLVLRLYAAKGKPVRLMVLEERLASATGRDISQSSRPVVPVLAHRVRKALGRDVISNFWSVGFALSDRGIAMVAAVLGDTGAPAHAPQTGAPS